MKRELVRDTVTILLLSIIVGIISNIICDINYTVKDPFIDKIDEIIYILREDQRK